MGISTNTYILIGVKVDPKWGVLPSDFEQDKVDPYDLWAERIGDFNSYDPKPGELTTFSDLDGDHWRFFGRVVDFDQGRWSSGTEFFESYDVARLDEECTEVGILLKERWGIEERPKLWIVSVST